ncbi:molybdopterin-dependent oxidoreductase [Megasphaera butyrica]|uniref:xanthine dehydrogenase family protein molybdopterin-binding subunit n=1 Tax=Megasphaera butyrica TaxID=2981791 RepID=UPI000822FCC0|nr:molybdopterin cofactor-binding domain-containing protein [Megasphaera butyrica]MCU6715315.1 molybdopterin-dependent oxidoreductase [Megasphaera butyrica]SCI03376.1 4-hydroxybenzoyl-CoA reductase subunit alpha [uncultured Megasphaera sp.]SCI78207.1 4-hydroxybenzoyl-CoA reductase subunit alpha [uncultured Ruminococcus sp.]
MKAVNQPIMKKDAVSLVTGQPVYTEDIAPKDCLVVKALRSSHAHAWVKSVQTDAAKKVPGIVCIVTADDVPHTRFTIAGQTYPELSPYDKLILDKHIRYVGDPVALVAGVTEEAVDKALRIIRVEYDVLEPLLDFTKAKDNPIVVHPEEDWNPVVDVSGDNKRNLVAQAEENWGDVEGTLASSDIVIDRTYHTKQVQQSMMETFRAYSYKDMYGRLTIVSSTQVPFHVRRIVATALEIPKSQVRVIKPRIGGGFGAKQTAVMEVYPAVITHITGKPAMMIYTREESMTVSSPRHEAAVHVKVGASKDGRIRVISVESLWNAGAYGDHSPTTVTLSGHKSIPLYNQFEAFRFAYEAVYTNTIAAGAYRGYGATQGIFALESAVNELAAALQMDPVELRLKNMVRQGETMPAYFDETALSCTLDQCLLRVKDMIGWDEKYPRKVLPNGHIRSVGLSLAMQGSSISNVDVASVTIKVNDDGFYSLNIGATDMGTGCDTILAQIAAECLQCPVDNIVTYGVDTDTSPYDSGSYASSTTYLTGKAVEKTCQTLIQRMKERAALVLKPAAIEDLDFTGEAIVDVVSGKAITIKDLGNGAMCGNEIALEATESHYSPTSPPPYMAGAAEIDLDPETGHIELVDFAAVVDCGTVINPALARVQVEGGLVQGIGMALMEDVTITETGRIQQNSFMQYRIPSRMDLGSIRVEFAPSYEPNGPFGAKSIGEIVINTPSPAIADAVYNAVGVRFTDLPITAEKVYMTLKHKQ